MPFITYWKGKITPGVSDALVSQVDLLASIAELLGREPKDIDSQKMLKVLKGETEQGREELIIEATSRTALRKGDWFMIPPYKGPAVNKQVNIELGNSNEYQLYNLKEDPGQKKNIARQEPDKLMEMISAFEEIRGKDYGQIEQLELK